MSSYNGQFWSGELAAYPIDPVTGQVALTSTTQIWEARDQLTARTPDSRVIVTYDGAYSHQFTVDGTPTIGDIKVGGAWKTALVAGLAAGGKGYYALDVTHPVPADSSAETDVAAKVLWEFPNAATSATVRANVGLTFGRPVLAKTAATGWVALVTSGYNNYDSATGTGDGRGYLFVLDAGTGALSKAISTNAGSTASPSGLGQISAYATSAQTDATIDYVYGGDLQGNVWRFDLTGPSSGWNVARLATLVDANGAAQPISTAPELISSQNRRLIVVGTGLLIGQSDVASTQTQSIYALVDDLTATPTIAAPRTALYHKTVAVGAGNVRNIPSDAVDLAAYRGWYFDLPGSGERLTDDLSAVFGALVFATNQPSPVACNAKSYIYAVDAAHGGQLPSAGFLSGETAWTGKQLGANFASQPVIAMLASGTDRGADPRLRQFAGGHPPAAVGGDQGQARDLEGDAALGSIAARRAKIGGATAPRAPRPARSSASAAAIAPSPARRASAADRTPWRRRARSARRSARRAGARPAGSRRRRGTRRARRR